MHCNIKSDGNSLYCVPNRIKKRKKNTGDMLIGMWKFDRMTSDAN